MPTSEIDPTTTIDDDELAMLALAADPDAVVPDDAVPFHALAGGPLELLPGWYMAASAGGAALRPWQRWTVGVLVAAFVLINAAGMCSTYGWVVVA
jgi:hypothetical protein